MGALNTTFCFGQTVNFRRRFVQGVLHYIDDKLIRIQAKNHRCLSSGLDPYLLLSADLCLQAVRFDQHFKPFHIHLIRDLNRKVHIFPEALIF